MSSSREPLFTVRAAVVLLTALLVALVGGAVAFLAYQDLATAVLVGGGASVGQPDLPRK
jgi:hypothetical protein